MVLGLLVVEEEKVELVVMHQITLMLVMVVQDIMVEVAVLLALVKMVLVEGDQDTLVTHK